MSSGSPPPAPDYEAAAESTSEGNLALARQTTQANRPDEYNPYGSRTWTQGFDQAGYDQALSDFESGDAARTQATADAQADYSSRLDAFNAGGNQRRYDAGLGEYIDAVAPEYISPDMSIYNDLSAPDRKDYLTDQWTSNINLSDAGQALFDQNNLSQSKLSELGLMGLDQMKGTFDSKFSIDGNAPEYSGQGGSVPTYQGGNYDQTRGDVVDAMMSRVNTDIGRDRESQEAQLIAQGIPKGSEAFNRQMENLDRKQTDARQQANIVASSQAAQEHGLRQGDAQAKFVNDMTSRGMSETEALNLYRNQMSSRQQGISENLVERNQPLNEYSAFQSGSQVSMPQFQAYGNMPQVSGPDYMGATNALSDYNMAGYNAGVSGRNSLTSGLFTLGAGALMSPAGTFGSDERMKHNIVKIGSYPSGLSKYEFSYLGSKLRHIGVMAQEAIKTHPLAVFMMPDGYYSVNYGAIN